MTHELLKRALDALERMTTSYQLLLAQKPVRDVPETLAEAWSAIEEITAALSSVKAKPVAWLVPAIPGLSNPFVTTDEQVAKTHMNAKPLYLAAPLASVEAQKPDAWQIHAAAYAVAAQAEGDAQ